MTAPHPTAFRLRSALVVLPALALVALAGSALVEAAAGTDALPEGDATWFEGAAGFAEGFERAESQDQAVLLYFYADWCGYCRQLESALLYQADVEDYTQYLVKIRVNPEDGPGERELARRYGVRGYPAVFLHAVASEGPQRLGRMVIDGGKRRMMTPDEYVQMLTRASGKRFLAL